MRSSLSSSLLQEEEKLYPPPQSRETNCNHRKKAVRHKRQSNERDASCKLRIIQNIMSSIHASDPLRQIFSRKELSTA